MTPTGGASGIHANAENQTISGGGKHVIGTRTALIAALALVAFVLAQPAWADQSLWYNTQSSWTSNSQLYSYDVSSGLSTDRGTLVGLKLLTDITFGADGTLYGVGWANASASGAARLYAITPGDAGNPASFTQLAVQGDFSGAPHGLEYHAGALYVSSGDKSFYKLAQLNDGSWMVEKEGHMNHASSGDLAFAPDGVLYATVVNGNQTRLATVNFDTTSNQFGRSDFVGGSTGYAQVMGLAFQGGTLYAAASSDNFSASKLITLNTSTGSATFVGDLSQAAWGMAAGGGDGVPEPATVALLAVGLVAMGFAKQARRPATAKSAK